MINGTWYPVSLNCNVHNVGTQGAYGGGYKEADHQEGRFPVIENIGV